MRGGAPGAYDRAMTTDDAALARAVITNWEALGTALAARFDGAVVHDIRGHRFRSGLHSGFMNGVIRMDVPADDVPAVAAEMRAWFPDGLPWRWVVGPGSGPPDLADRLRELGFEARWPHMPTMAIDLRDFDGDRWTSPDAPVTEVLDTAELDDWLTVRRTNLRLDEPTMAAWRRANGEMGLGPDSALRQFVGRLDKRPVAACSLFLDPASQTAGIYHVDVVEDARGRGLGKAVTAAALGAACAAGYPLGVLSASKLGTPVYLRLGFRNAGSLVYFVGGGH